MSQHALIRRLVIEEVEKLCNRREGQLRTLYGNVMHHANGMSPNDQLYMMDVLNELFLNGTIAPGLDAGGNSTLPFFRLTERGRKSYENISRDPGNRDGYLANLSANGLEDEVALSYIEEATNAYHHSCYKSAAVMTGCAAERLVLMIRDELAEGLTRRGRSVPKKLSDWQFKTVRDAITQEIDSQASDIHDKGLQDLYRTCWSPFTEQLRQYRNDAGHPKSVEPITTEIAHVNLLMFPEFVRLSNGLITWIGQHYI